jgi:protoheme IX farnesyltransferase
MKSRVARIRIRDYLELGKIKIMIPVSLTGFTGFFIYNPGFSFSLLLVSLGILLLGISASVLNQIQEADPDSRMERTQNRPIPSQRIKPQQALIFLICNLMAGIILIYSAGNLTAVLIGLMAIVWYNGIYTYLKKITAFAVFPGAVTGALPPLIGWVAAGGGLWDKPIVFLEFLFFTGQIPHFWLLILKYGEEYEKAGIPSLTKIMSSGQISRLTFIWVVTSAIAALFLCYFQIIQTKIIIVILLTASVFLIWQFSGLLKIQGNKDNCRKYTILLDSYYLLVMILLVSDRILR